MVTKRLRAVEGSFCSEMSLLIVSLTIFFISLCEIFVYLCTEFSVGQFSKSFLFVKVGAPNDHGTNTLKFAEFSYTLGTMKLEKGKNRN